MNETETKYEEMEKDTKEKYDIIFSRCIQPRINTKITLGILGYVLGIAKIFYDTANEGTIDFVSEAAIFGASTYMFCDGMKDIDNEIHLSKAFTELEIGKKGKKK